MNKNRWEITLQEDPETKDLILPLSDEILKEFGWKIGDTIQWTDNKNGTWSLKLFTETSDDIEHSEHWYDVTRNQPLK
jgi:hypothetical protein